MEKHILSKSTFIRGLQCHKSLYLYKYNYNLRDKISEEQKAIFNRGTNVGLYAQKLFPGGVDVTPPSPFKYQESVIKTTELINSGAEVIYEAAFQFEQTLVAVDILVKRENAWYAYEVKSSTKVSPTYILDACLQHYVIQKSGVELKDFFITYINNQYARLSHIDLKKLFNFQSVKKEADAKEEYFNQKICELKGVLKEPFVPDIKIGEQCTSPYPCDFMGHCNKEFFYGENSVFNMCEMSLLQKTELYNSGIKTIQEIPTDYELRKNQKIQVEAVKSNQPIINKGAIKEFVNTVSYPLYFLDFEAYMPAIPVYPNTKPFHHLPFLYSIHYKKSKEESLQHLFFLAESNIDPRKSFIENLIAHLGSVGDILSYDAKMERSILNAMKKEFPQFTSQIDNILNRIKDLSTPFENKWYYTKEMNGSHSLKNVLLGLKNNVSYTELVINTGVLALNAFDKLQTETDIFKIAELRDALIEYCKMDTWTMVKVFERLEELSVS